MADTIEYIESYFHNTLSQQERTDFESKCKADVAFAREVAVYVAARSALYDELLQQKEKEWAGEKNISTETTPIISIGKKSIFGKLLTYAAAACVVLAASVYIFETHRSPRRLAENYIKTNYDNLSQTMSADKDSITLGIAAYNNKDYDRAIMLFEGVEQRNSSNTDAKKYAGLAYLQKKDYDNALSQFDNLANTPNLFSNPGDFLKAITLLERDQSGDNETARQLLQEVVDKKEEGNKEATELLNKF